MAVQHLPQHEQVFLNTLRDDLPALRARVIALREQGWTLNAIGEPLGAGRSTVRSWENHPDALSALPPDSPPLPSPPNLRPAPIPGLSPSPRVRSLRPDVPADDQARIRNLAPLARKVRGGTPQDSPFRKAKRELDSLLLTYYERRVPVQTLAEYAGVSYRAMKVRLDAAARAARLAHPSHKAAGL